MSKTREKLVELLKVVDSETANIKCYKGEEFDVIADHLITNGVTLQKWINFDEIKPKNGKSVLGITTEGEMEVYQFDENWQTCLCQYGGNVKTFNITHWMPLPEPPKGE